VPPEVAATYATIKEKVTSNEIDVRPAAEEAAPNLPPVPTP